MNLPTRFRRFMQTNALAWFVARRYLFSRERRALEWMVTGISIAGVAVGVGTIIAVFGVIAGMREKILGEIIADYPSLTVYPFHCSKEAPDPAILATLRAWPGVIQAEPVLRQNAALLVGKGRAFVQLEATDGLRENNIFNVKVPRGTTITPQPGKVLVASSMLSRGALTSATLNLRSVTVVSDAMIKTALYPIPKRRTMEIQGKIEMNNSFVGSHVVFASWADVRELAQRPVGYDGIYVRLADPLAAGEVRGALRKVLPKRTNIEAWLDHFEQMFSDMTILSAGMLLVMLMTMLVAALNIIGTLTLIVIQKTREIGILKAMGGSRRLVGRIFIAEGALVGLVGSLLGAAMGVTFCVIVRNYQIPIPVTGKLFGEFKTIPAQLNLWTVVATAAAAVVICTAAALAPAWRAGGLDPVVALRHE